LLLSAEFHTAKQGSTSITDFCRHLEMMAATLADYGDPIGDRTLVLTLLRGLNGKFRPMVSNLKMRQPFPTFEEARMLLLLKEIDIDDITTGKVAGASDPPASSTSTALVATPRPLAGRPHGGRGQGHPGTARADPLVMASPAGRLLRPGRHCRPRPQPTAAAAAGLQRQCRPATPGAVLQSVGGPRPPNAPGTQFRPPPAAFTAHQQYVQQLYTLGPPPGFGYGGAPPP
jgi:hypothetical protein